MIFSCRDASGAGSLEQITTYPCVRKCEAGSYVAYKAANFASNRLGYFHYVIHAHRYTDFPDSSGQAELIGDDIIVSLSCSISSDYIRNTTMHELGHNLGLQHGGNNACTYQPNYNSVMNYQYQFTGVDTDCDARGDYVANYSTGTRISIDENHANETLGVCGTKAIDWNNNGVIQSNVQVDLNQGSNATCGGTYTVLNDFNDWAAIYIQSLPGSQDAGQNAGIVQCPAPIPLP